MKPNHFSDWQTVRQTRGTGTRAVVAVSEVAEGCGRAAQRTRLLALAVVGLGALLCALWKLLDDPQVLLTTSAALGGGLIMLCITAWFVTARSPQGTMTARTVERDDTESQSRFPVCGEVPGSAEPPDSPSASQPESEERERFRAIIDNLPDSLYVKDSQSRFLLNNAAHIRALGGNITAEQMRGKNDFDFFPKDVAERYRSEEKEIMRSGKPVNVVRLQTDKLGARRWVSITKMPWRNSAGVIAGTVGITRDVNELKLTQEALLKSQQLYRTLVDCLPQQVVYKDRELNFLSVNAGFARLAGQRADELMGKNDHSVFPREVAERRQADDRRVLESGHPEVMEEVDIHEGRRRVLEVTRVPVISEDGLVVGLLGIFTDITERKLAEEKLREFNSQLERSNRELQDFAYVASHDLQEPLRKIVVFGDRLREKFGSALTDEGRDFLERMQKAARRMQALISDLLTFSRVTSKAQPFRPVDLAEMTQEIVGDLEGRLEQVKGRVEVGPLPTIEAEPVQMRQLIQNLIGNALKFHRKNEAPVVRVEAQTTLGTRPRGSGALSEVLLQLTISDNGIGFDEKYLDRIFNVFQRLHTKNEYEGTGMGLAICRKIAHHHGGEITARSEPDRGSTFLVTLPVSQPKGQSHE
jgi:PAS domain S-box-containing protein